MRFVVQRHKATNLHYDLRLELNGVLASWAVPKEPPTDSTVKRQAVRVEDHTVEYIDFEGEIPAGKYGAGTVSIWDRGTYVPIDSEMNPISEKIAGENLRSGELKFLLNGGKLNGAYVLVRMIGTDKWLFIKQKVQRPKETSLQAGPSVKKVKRSKTERTVIFNRHQVTLTNINKIYWPDEKITKGQMLDYYEAMAPVILPYLKDRPLSLNLMPNGIRGKGFYHKEAGEHVPDFVLTEPVESLSSGKTIDYIICNNAASLLYVANLGSIEMNP
jgi:bifunctional non-homologous end joining protein LigD